MYPKSAFLKKSIHPFLSIGTPGIFLTSPLMSQPHLARERRRKEARQKEKVLKGKKMINYEKLQLNLTTLHHGCVCNDVVSFPFYLSVPQPQNSLGLR